MRAPKILVVDDEPFNLDYMQQELEEADYVILTAANGQEALDLVQSEAPDLILLDIMMPVMDGFEVLARLKATPAQRDIPVIIISAMNDLQSVVRGIKMGAEDYLPKPFEPTLLFARVSSCLEKKRLRDLQTLYLKSLEREFEIARDIQKDFLPSKLPQIEGWEVSAYFKAAREVTGDYYDVFLLPDGNLAVVIGDVCGKGVGAALFMTIFRSLTHATLVSDLAAGSRGGQVILPREQLHATITFVNDYLNQTHADAEMFSTIFISLLNLKTNTLSYINCGNESPLVLRAGQVIATLAPSGPVVGVLPEAKYYVKEVVLDPGDILLAFTDGIPDALNSNDEPYERERLAQSLAGFAGSASGLLEGVKTRLFEFIGTANQFDDITLLAIKRC